MEPLTVANKKQIAERLWGANVLSGLNPTRIIKYNAFFDHCQLQITENIFETNSFSHIRSHRDLLDISDILKEHAHLSRREIHRAIETTRYGLGNGQWSYGTLTDLQDGVLSSKATNAALATTVRALFAINLNLSPGKILVGQSDLNWKEDQLYEDFVQEVFPVYDFADEPHTPIKSNKLRARYLESYADVQLEWTHHLPDHLKLDLGDQTKILRVFALPSLLEMTYERMKDEPWQLPLSDSLKIGCYSPQFLYETLQTILLLFPTQDRQWLDQKLHYKPRWYQWKRGSNMSVDKRLSVPFKGYHRESMYDRPLTTRRELFARYPHWAVRLHTLYTEAEDPTPVSRFSRWAERRRAARHTFWITFIAFMVAILFGILASVLAAIQIWISYCQWKGDGKSRICG